MHQLPEQAQNHLIVLENFSDELQRRAPIP